MNLKTFSFVRLSIILLVLILAGSSAAPYGALRAANGDDTGMLELGPNPFETQMALQAASGVAQAPFYQNVLLEWLDEGAKFANSEVSINATNFTSQSNDEAGQIGNYKGKNNVLIWKNNFENWIEYTFEVPETGLYNFELHYHPYISTEEDAFVDRGDANLGVEIDGDFIFREAKSIPFKRAFKDTFPINRNELGHDVRPQAVQIEKWMQSYFYDGGGAYSEPLQWYLTKGTHTIRFTSRDSIVMEQIKLLPPRELLSYEEVSATYPQVETHGDVIRFEAEQVSEKDTISIQLVDSQDAGMTPKADGYRRLNSIGGDGWRDGGQSASWTFTVEEDGLYHIAMRTRQNFSPDHSSFRTIFIDGEVPFKEMLEYKFPFKSNWGGTIIENEDGEAYEFYLTKGEHTLTMRSTYSPFQPIVVNIEKVILELQILSRELHALTGGVVDPHRTWRIKRDYPEFLDQLEYVRRQIVNLQTLSVQINGKRDNVSATLGTAAADIQALIDNANDIPNRLDQLSKVQNAVGSIRSQLIAIPVQFDTIYIVPNGTEMPVMTASFWSKFITGVKNFFYSFSRMAHLSSDDEDVLHVWMKFGRDYVDLLQEMVDQYYTPETGVRVSVDLLPSEQVLVLANAAGKQPDLVLGVSEGQPVNFGIRGAAADLSQFPGFDEMLSNYAPGSVLPYYYDGAYYGLSTLR